MKKFSQVLFLGATKLTKDQMKKVVGGYDYGGSAATCTAKCCNGGTVTCDGGSCSATDCGSNTLGSCISTNGEKKCPPPVV